MIRALVALLALAIVAWAPWMGTNSGRAAIERAFHAFAPLPAKCYDAEGVLLLDGLTIHWYPLGRLLHTCGKDYVVWFWGDVTELGGVWKKAADIEPPRARELTCTEIIERQDARLSTTSPSVPQRYEGPAALEADLSQFPNALEYAADIEKALVQGANFSGRFAVAEWGCGNGCQNHAVVDVETGRVVAVGPTTEFGISFSIDDTLLITNPLQNLPPALQNDYEAENQALSVARVPREYYRLTNDALSGTYYLVKLCVESAATRYIGVVDERLGLP